MTYKQILKQMEELQRDLMDIEDYDEEAYQAMQKTIDTLEDVIEEEGE